MGAQGLVKPYSDGIEMRFNAAKRKSQQVNRHPLGIYDDVAWYNADSLDS